MGKFIYNKIKWVLQVLKSYTDIEQSRKLAEILPLESADMMYHSVENEYGSGAFVVISKVITNGFENDDFYIDDIPCWSLAALFNILPDTITSNDGIAFKLNIKKNIIEYSNPSLYLIYKSIKADNLIDACVEMIIHLNELKILLL